MRFGISTLKRTISALMIGAFLLIGMAAPAEAQRRGKNKNKWDRHDTRGRHDNGRHTGWTRGRHLGWGNRDWDDDDRRRRRRRAFRRDRRDDRRDWRDNRRTSQRRWDRNDWRTRAYGNRVGYNRRFR
ncbi:MAG TPA: hypothetical protein VF240_22580 [Pyrinomonadaceae bacterium]